MGINVLVFEDERIHILELIDQSRLGKSFINPPESVAAK
jgi:hypothetical protein